MKHIRLQKKFLKKQNWKKAISLLWDAPPAKYVEKRSEHIRSRNWPIWFFAGIYEATKEYGVYLAAQCCEHSNRALILEKDAARKYGYPMVNVVPQPKAGGSFATAAYKNFKHPVAVEHIKAAAGMDIGDTLIGMHLQDVAVPTRIETKQIGNAHVVCARTRLKFIGGERAVYDHDLM